MQVAFSRPAYVQTQNNAHLGLQRCAAPERALPFELQQVKYFKEVPCAKACTVPERAGEKSPCLLDFFHPTIYLIASI